MHFKTREGGENGTKNMAVRRRKLRLVKGEHLALETEIDGQIVTAWVHVERFDLASRTAVISPLAFTETRPLAPTGVWTFEIKMRCESDIKVKPKK